MTIERLSQVVAAARADKREKIQLSKLFTALRTAFLYGSATFDAASLADGAGATTTVTVTGAVLGDFAMCSFSLDVQGISVTAYVSAANTVSVRFQNESAGIIDLASGTLRALVLKRESFDASTVLGLLA